MHILIVVMTLCVFCCSAAQSAETKNVKIEVKDLIDQLNDPNNNDRQKSVRALAAIRPVKPDVLNALIATLDDSDRFLHEITAECLGEMGPLAQQAVPAAVLCPHEVVEDLPQGGWRRIGRDGVEAVVRLHAGRGVDEIGRIRGAERVVDDRQAAQPDRRPQARHRGKRCNSVAGRYVDGRRAYRSGGGRTPLESIPAYRTGGIARREENGEPTDARLAKPRRRGFPGGGKADDRGAGAGGQARRRR